MITIVHILYAVFTLFSVGSVLYGLFKKSESAINMAVWAGFLAIFLLYNLAHGEILGLFFNYTNSMLYTINLLVLIIGIVAILYRSKSLHKYKIRHYTTGFVTSIIFIAGIILLVNVWINAYFIENRKANVPVIQNAVLGDNPHCNYHYLFYKMTSDNKVLYLCPNKYGLIPGIGKLDTVPKFLEHQFKVIGQKNPN